MIASLEHPSDSAGLNDRVLSVYKVGRCLRHRFGAVDMTAEVSLAKNFPPNLAIVNSTMTQRTQLVS